MVSGTDSGNVKYYKWGFDFIGYFILAYLLDKSAHSLMKILEWICSVVVRMSLLLTCGRQNCRHQYKILFTWVEVNFPHCLFDGHFHDDIV